VHTKSGRINHEQTTILLFSPALANGVEGLVRTMEPIGECGGGVDVDVDANAVDMALLDSEWNEIKGKEQDLDLRIRTC
jgi:hypothetical protein